MHQAPHHRPRLVGSAAVLVGAACLLPGCGKPFKVQEEVVLTAPAPAAISKLIIENVTGDIIVSASADATVVRAEVTKTGKGSTLSDAEDAVDEIAVILMPKEGEPGVMVATAKHPVSSRWREYWTRWEITAPAHVAIQAASSFGDIRADGFPKGAALHSGFGDIHAKAGGTVNLSTDFGEVDAVVLRDNPGPVSITTDFGDVSVSIPPGRQGRLTARTDFGDLDIHLEGMNLRLVRQQHDAFSAEMGAMNDPPIDLSTDFGDVRVSCESNQTTAASR